MLFVYDYWWVLDGWRDKEEKEERRGGEEEEEEGHTDNDAKKREKKVIDLPGQKRDPLEERDPFRIFYETLYKQVPTSDMASTWMMESGFTSKGGGKEVFREKTETGTATKAWYPNKICCAQEESRICYSCE
ncbi:uncharacterized protein [Primulina eburnea]|uniref:uncharacterized protein n=1 Tax=Primulina eburnea TaxID=1245227 RepID=UPI003C6C3BAB